MKKVIILYPNGFPYGGAATNRVLHIAKAITEGGIDTEILITRGTEKRENILNNQVYGFFEGVEFHYSSNNVIWPKNKLKKLFNTVKGVKNSILRLLNKKEAYEVIISYGDYRLSVHAIYYLVAKLINKKFVYVVDEYPWAYIYKNKKVNIIDKFKIRIFYKLFDGLIVMTNKLKDYYSMFVLKSCKLFLLPMTVDVRRFDGKQKKTNDNYIAYVGGEAEKYNKDGINVLIEAFSTIAPEFKNLKLYLIGNKNKTWLDEAAKYSLDNQIKFIGKVSPQLVPEYLNQAKVLVLARPANTQAEGGFPTKLGEYLASGTPVLATNVGEIKEYLEDESNIFLAEPGSSLSFAEKLDYILTNYDHAVKVGIKGRKAAQEIFDYRNYSNQLVNYIKDFE